MASFVQFGRAEVPIERRVDDALRRISQSLAVGETNAEAWSQVICDAVFQSVAMAMRDRPGLGAVVRLLRYGLNNRQALSTAAMVNRDQLNALVRRTALASVSETINDNLPDSYDEVVEDLRTLQESFDQELLVVGDDETFERLVALRTSVTNHMLSEARQRARLETIVPEHVSNTLTLSHLLYGRADRADEISGRNNLEQPGFILPNEIQVLVK